MTSKGPWIEGNKIRFVNLRATIDTGKKNRSRLFLRGTSASSLAEAFRVNSIARKARVSVMENWQSIETAPEDGTSILLTDGSRFAAGSRRWRQIEAHKICSFWELVGCSGFSPDVDVNDNYGRTASFNPTHWMPLPNRPRGNQTINVGYVAGNNDLVLVSIKAPELLVADVDCEFSKKRLQVALSLTRARLLRDKLEAFLNDKTATK